MSVRLPGTVDYLGRLGARFEQAEAGFDLRARRLAFNFCILYYDHLSKEHGRTAFSHRRKYREVGQMFPNTPAPDWSNDIWVYQLRIV